MCGILGLVARPGRSPDVTRPQLVRMRDVMEARGPDSAGLFQQDNVAFAHRRLAIRDRAHGTQPWVSADRQQVLVYNGEVYNDAELRVELAALGQTFESRCDTEVVLAAYRQWGPECVSRLRGMFAFGIYDFSNRRLFLARDRFGIKPLFFTQRGGELVFASTIAALLAHPEVTKKPCFPAVSHYLTTFRTTLGRQTLYEGIWQLLPGETLTLDDDRVRIERYWEYPESEDSTITYRDAAGLLEDALREAVSLRLTSDVPVGLFLSGGVDSNTLAALLCETHTKTTPGWCGGGDGAALDDFGAARRCARHFAVEYGEVRVAAAEYFDLWLWMIRQTALPLATPTDVVLYALARDMKPTIGVALGGEGADELLCGYSVAHWAGYDFDRQQQLAHGTWQGSLAGQRIFRRSLKSQYGREYFTSAVDHYFALNSLIPAQAKPLLFQPAVWEAADSDRLMHEHYHELFDRFPAETTQQTQTRVLHSVNLESLLSRLDAATMLAGLEARVPYTDHRLVETMFRVPATHKIAVANDEQAGCLASAELERRGSVLSKRILRTVAAPRMPASLALRKKASFPTPVADWLARPWIEHVRTRLYHSPFARATFRPEALNELAGNPKAAGMWLWPLLNVIEWGDAQFGG